MISKQDYVTPTRGTILKYEGILDLDKLYKESKAWFKEREYDFHEKRYEEKLAEVGSELRIEFDATRVIDDLTSFNISVKFFISNSIKSGKKYKLNLTAYVSGYIDLDYKNKWQSNAIKSFLFFIYINFINRNKIEDLYEGKLFYDVEHYIEFLRKYFD